MEIDRPFKHGDLKQYPHFDKPISLKNIKELVTNPTLVARNPFYPFIRYEKSWQPFRVTGSKPPKKEREIRYASRRDSYIFSYYRSILSEKYETELKKLGIENCPIAYRRVPVDISSDKGKCNIHFAKDAFEQIKKLESSYVICLDIKKYFESIDHDRIATIWCRLLGVHSLPSDHARIFEAITDYRYVDRDKLYERLGFFGPKVSKSGRSTKGFLTPFKKMPIQLCSSIDFREKVCGKGNKFESIIQKNEHRGYGIPQGAPISDLIANFYLIDFDKDVHSFVSSLGGTYTRYSDDILIIVPRLSSPPLDIEKYVETAIKKHGRHLEIKSSKTSVHEYFYTSGKLGFNLLAGQQGRNGLEYLGFRFDGRKVYLRDKTLSGFYRKFKGAARAEINKMKDKMPGISGATLSDKFNYANLVKKFGRVDGFTHDTKYKDWTFWTYAERASRIFGTEGAPIMRQLRKHKRLIRDHVNKLCGLA